MQTLKVVWDAPGLEFTAAKRLADAAAGALLEEPLLLSWYDRQRDIESPQGVSECHRGCEVPGVVDYATSRGGALVVDINQAGFLFCYRPLGEFA
jgi:hypothetical protein